MAAPHTGFTLAGIPVRVQPAFFIIIVLLGVLSYPMPFPLTWVAIATVSVVVHELGHAVAFRSFGLVPSITLHSMGGLTSASVGEAGAPTFTPARSIVTSLAGPLSALVLFGVPAYIAARGMGFEPLSLARDSQYGAVLVQRTGAHVGADRWMVASPVQVLLSQAVYINVGWSLLNLIPVLPLDGGNVTASVIELVTPRNGRRAANVISIVAAVLLAWWGFVSGFIFGPLLAAMLIGMNVSELAASRQESVDQDLADAARALVDFDPDRAERLTRAVLAGKVDGDRRRVATELFAWSRLARGDAAGAEQAMGSMPPGDGPTATLRAALSLARGRTLEGVTTMAWALAHDPDRSAKVLGAIAVAQSGQVDAVTHELLLLGPAGREGGALLRSGLDRTGHTAEALRVGHLLAL
jgi:stage IV sporulation protein FB